MSQHPTSRPRGDALVVAANRIPFAKAGGRYAHASNQDMLTAALDGLVARHGLAGERLGEVAAGAVLKHARDYNLTREAVLGSALDARTPAHDLQQACGTGLETIVQVANKISLGQIDAGIGAGVDTASDAPVSLGDGLRRALLDASRARTLGQRLAALAAVRPGDLAPETPRNAEPRTGLSMGEHMARTAAAWGISREAQDALAATSHQRLAAAWDEGFFDDLVTPFLGLDRDELLRPDSTAEKLAELKVVFGRDGHAGQPGTLTAGNSTALSDGASAVLLANERWTAERRITPLARLVDAESAAVDHVHGPDGLLMAPVFAVPRLLQRQGLSLQDFDFYEVHEAFAATVEVTLAAWEDDDFCRARLGLPGALGPIDRSRLNVKGSSLAAGHPFAATGGRIVGTLATLLHQQGRGRGLVSICAAGGQGVVAILEAV
ncbi:acetyl-CoA C-acetyltransferase [Kytococcus sp. Marseille-QA3725]